MPAYHRPRTLDEARGLLARGGLRIAAGCTDLFPTTDRPALGGDILDITGIGALRGITAQDGALRIGATTTWSDIIRADLPPAFDMLKEAAAEVGSVQIQNAGTVAGNICNASPAADGIPCLLTLDARVEIAAPEGDLRLMPLADFVTGARQTALSADEIVTALLIPDTAMAGRSRFLKLGARRYLVISIAMVALRLEVSAGRIIHAAIAVGACSAVATRLPALEEALSGQPLDPRIRTFVTPDLVGAALSPIDDMRADAAYRVTAATELIRRALDDLCRAEAGAVA